MIAGAPAAESEIQQFLAMIPMPAFVIRRGRVVASNDRFCALLGRGQAELVAAPDPFHAFVAPEDADKLFARHAARTSASRWAVMPARIRDCRAGGCFLNHSSVARVVSGRERNVRP